MARFVSLILAIAFLSAAFLLLFRSDERLTDWAEPTSASASDATVATVAADVASADRARDPAVAIVDEDALAPTTRRSLAADLEPSGPSSDFVVRGRVLLVGDSSPVAGVRVRITTPEGTSIVRTTAGGTFESIYDQPVVVNHFAVLPGDTTGDVHVPDGRRAMPGHPLEVELRVGVGGTLRGQVTDVDGEPVPGAEVLVWTGYRGGHRGLEPGRVVVAGADGLFEARHVGPQFVLEARSPGYVCVVGQAGTLEQGELLEYLELELAREWEVHGIVVGPAGRPVADALVEPGSRSWIFGDFHFIPWRDGVRTAEDGSFTLAMSGSRDQGLRVRADGYREEVVPLTEDAQLLVRLERGLCLRGTVRDEAGQPIAGAHLRATVEASGSSPESSSATSDASGRFEICGMSATAGCILEVHAPGFAIQARDDVAVHEDLPNSVEVVLERGRTIAGVVLDADGAPVHGAFLSLMSERLVPFRSVNVHPKPTWENRMGVDQATSDAEGRFRFEDLHDDVFELTVRPPWEAELALRFETPSGVEDLEVVLDEARMRGVVLFGAVVDDRSGEPIPNFRVTVMEQTDEDGWSGRLRSFEAGAYRIEGLREGAKQIHATAPGYARLDLSEERFEEGEHRRDLRLARKHVVLLEVLDEMGRPWPEGSDVRVYEDDAEEPFSIEVGQGSWMPFVSLDAEGRVRLPNLPSSRLRIEVRAPGDEGGSEAVLDLRFASADEPESVQLVVPRP